MAEQCFTGPGIIRLLNETGNLKVVNLATGKTVGSFNGTCFNGASCCEDRTGEVVIAGGEHCITYPDNWGADHCGCPAIPIFDFTPAEDGSADPAVLDCLAEIKELLQEQLDIIPPPQCSISTFCGEDDTLICKKLCVDADGVETETETDTGIDCSIPIQDAEIDYRCNPTTGNFDERLVIYSQEDGLILFDSGWVDTGEPCYKEEAPQCFPVCAASDGRFLWAKKAADGEITLLEADGITEATGETAGACDKEFIQSELCWQLVSDPETRFSQIVCVNKADDSDVNSIWIDGTGQVIPPPTAPIERCKEEEQDKIITTCYKDKFIEGGVDNTFTNFNHTNQKFKFTFSDGTTGIVNVPSSTGFSDQITQVAVGLDALMPWAQDVSPFCTTGCGGLSSPVVVLPRMKWRYVGFRVCPGDVYPESVEYTSDQTKAPVTLDLDFTETEVRIFHECKNCTTGEIIWCDPEGGSEAPICGIPCTEEFPETPGNLCEITSQEVCEFAYPADPESGDDPTLVTSGVTLQYNSCDGGPIKLQGGYTLDTDGTPLPHELTPGNYYGDCETGEEIVPPVTPCPEGAVFEPVEIGGSYFILDNSNWSGAPTPHITNGFNFEFTFTYDDGSQVIAQQSADPLYANMLSEFAAATGCAIVPVCANHTSPKGCNAVHAANLAKYPAYDSPTYPGDVQNNLVNPDQSELWATGWLFDCDDCGPKVVKVEITNSNNADYIGAFKEPIVYDKEPTVIFRAITCQGLFWKDCKGNDITGPADPCCVRPVSPDTKLPIEECCLVADPSDVNRYCQNFKASFPAGNSSPDTSYTYSVGGANASVPNPHTEAEALAALESLAPGAGWVFDSNGVLCNTSVPGGAAFTGITCSVKSKSKFTLKPIVSFIEGAEPVCKEFLRTWSKFEEPIADTLSVQTEKLCALADTITECESGIPDANYDGAIAITRGRPDNTVPWELIDNRDPNNQVIVVSGATFEEFSANLAAAGYSEFIEGEIHYICPCPAGLVNTGDFFVQADGNTVTKPACTPLTDLANAPEKNSVEPESALRVKLCPEDLEAILSKICEFIGDGGDECPCKECPTLIVGDTVDTNTDVPLTFPLLAPNTFVPFTTPITIEENDCLADNPTALVTIRITQDHEAGNYDNHRAYVLASSAGTFTAVSGSNSQAAASGTAAQQIGYAVGDAANGPRAVRWAELTLTVQDLLNGITLDGIAFGGVGGAFENIYSQQIEIVEGLTEICEGC